MAFEKVKVEFHVGRTESKKLHIFPAGTEKREISLCGKVQMINMPILKIFSIQDIKKDIEKRKADPPEFTPGSMLPKLFCKKCIIIFEKDYGYGVWEGIKTDITCNKNKGD